MTKSNFKLEQEKDGVSKPGKKQEAAGVSDNVKNMYTGSQLSVEDRNTWMTDPRVFAYANKEFNFCLDACASAHNTKVKGSFISKDMDCNKTDWMEVIKNSPVSRAHKKKLAVYINPPYGKGLIEPIMQTAVRMVKKGFTSVLLLPATPDSNWIPWEHVSEIRYITNGRLSFVHPVSKKLIHGGGKGSMFVIISKKKNKNIITTYVSRAEIYRIAESL